VASTIRRLKRSVQKAAKAGKVSAADAALASKIVESIARNGSCHVSEVARMLDEPGPLIDTERRLCEQLADDGSTLDGLREGWLRTAARAASRMRFITVDGSDHVKPYGKAFEHLDTVRDASDKRKHLEPGYCTVQIDANDEMHRNLPLWSETFSTKAPEYKSWWDTFLRPMLRVIAAVGRNATWLFDRGFDALDVLLALQWLRIGWVVRQVQSRLVALGNGELVPMHQLAAGLHKRHSVELPYVDKSTHEPRLATASFGFAPVRVPGIDAALTMIVIDGGRDEDIVLLTNVPIRRVEDAEAIVLAYLRRWGSEEATRAWKQLTRVEDFRVRRWNSIRRLTFLASMTVAIQALWLLTRPATAERYIARVKQFIEHVLFRHYRLWRGVQDALAKGS
jgi:hypothetical protein